MTVAYDDGDESSGRTGLVDAARLGRVRSAADLGSRVFRPLTWVVPGLIPEGFGLLVGAPKIGKSWVVLDVALAVATGRDALGSISTGDPRPVLLLALEDGDRRLQSRCRTILDEGEQIPGNLWYATDLAPAEVIPTVQDWLSRHGASRPLVVLDTLGKVMPPMQRNEQPYQRDYRIGSVLHSMIGQYPGAGLLVVHHTRKAASEDWMDSTSGTNGLNGAADWTLMVARGRGDTTGVVRVTGRDVADGEFAASITDEGRWVMTGDSLREAGEVAQTRAATSGLSQRSRDIYAAVQTLGRATPGEVEAETNLTNVRRYMTRLVSHGLLVRVAHGVYEPADKEPNTKENTP